MGAIHHALIGEMKDTFQPTNINLGLFPPLDKKVKKREKRDLIVQRARIAFEQWQNDNDPDYIYDGFIHQMADDLLAQRAQL